MSLTNRIGTRILPEKNNNRTGNLLLNIQSITTGFYFLLAENLSRKKTPEFPKICNWDCSSRHPAWLVFRRSNKTPLCTQPFATRWVTSATKQAVSQTQKTRDDAIWCRGCWCSHNSAHPILHNLFFLCPRNPPIVRCLHRFPKYQMLGGWR